MTQDTTEESAPEQTEQTGEPGEPGSGSGYWQKVVTLHLVVELDGRRVSLPDIEKAGRTVVERFGTVLETANPPYAVRVLRAECDYGYRGARLDLSEGTGIAKSSPVVLGEKKMRRAADRVRAVASWAIERVEATGDSEDSVSGADLGKSWIRWTLEDPDVEVWLITGVDQVTSAALGQQVEVLGGEFDGEAEVYRGVRLR